MSENIYNLRAGYYYNYTGICKNSEENLTTNEVVDLLNEKDKRIKRLENQLKHCEYKMAKSQQAQENLVSEIKNRIKYLQQTEFKYMESERLISIIELEWMLSLISSGSCEVYETEKIIDEIK